MPKSGFLMTWLISSYCSCLSNYEVKVDFITASINMKLCLYKHITKTCPCNKQRIFSKAKIENCIGKFLIFFLFFAQNIDCGYTLELPLRGDSNEYPLSMLGANIRKIGIPLHTPVLLYKSGVQGGIHYTDMF